MRLWSLHPQYLDAKGLVALWREGLLAQAVLAGQTKGYRNHPQLARFLQTAAPQSYLTAYLKEVHAESLRRGYRFDERKLGRVPRVASLTVTHGQLQYEWEHLHSKLRSRDPAWLREIESMEGPEPHPLFRVIAGGIAAWEKVPPLSAAHAELTEALALARTAGSAEALLQALKRLGQLEREFAQFGSAIARYEEAVALCRRAAAPLALAHTIRHLGDVQRAAGQLDRAEACYLEAMALYRSQPDAPLLDLANALRPLAILRQSQGEFGESRTLWEEARGLYEAAHVEAGVAECTERLAHLGA